MAGLLFAVAWGANHFVPLLPVYRVALGLSSEQLAQIFGIYALGLVPGLLLGGPQSDRWGRARLVLPAAVVALVGSGVLGGFQPSFAQLLLGRFVVGIGSGVVFSAATAWVQDLAGAAGARGAGARRATVALSLGFGGGPLMAGLLAQWGPSPLRSPFVLQGLVLIVAWGLVVTALVGQPVRAPDSAASVRPSAGRVWPLPPGFVRDIVPAAPWVFALPSISSAVLPTALLPNIGGQVAVFAGGIAATTLLAGVLVQGPLRRVTPLTAARVGTGCGAVGLFIAAAALRGQSPAGVAVAALAMGAGYGGCLVAGLRFIELESPAFARGAHTGIFYVLAYLGFAAPLLLAWVSKEWGTAGAVTWAAAAASATARFLLVTSRRAPAVIRGQ
ncbi:MAG TPA: MFS transporter [Polyangia bacterium]